MFYSVIETRDFSLFNQSAQALLKGYFIKSCITLYSVLQGESKKSDDCDMYNRNVIPCGV